ncbi:hypothetical protein V490_03518 [Pseudogymnoascus sp. VKM F-3557]|nr:hypothetical protein V490_03518 [Pseudogymnoascus sp. VKM F-3557]
MPCNVCVEKGKKCCTYRFATTIERYIIDNSKTDGQFANALQPYGKVRGKRTAAKAEVDSYDASNEEAPIDEDLLDFGIEADEEAPIDEDLLDFGLENSYGNEDQVGAMNQDSVGELREENLDSVGVRSSRSRSRKRKTHDDYEEHQEQSKGKKKEPGKRALMISSTQEIPIHLKPEPTTFRGALQTSEASEWQAAADEEYNSLVGKGVFEPCDLPPGRKALTVRWVFKRKLGVDGLVERYKARLVARGFEQKYGTDYEETFATVVKAPSYRLLFAISALFKWTCRQSDIKTAFLHPTLEEEIFIAEPEGYVRNPGKVLQLKKGLYGLKQASRLWYQELRKFYEKIGFMASQYDESVFYKNENDGTTTIYTTYVDDLLSFGPNLETIMQKEKLLSGAFDTKHLGDCHHYLGMEFLKNSRGETFIHQATYIQQILDRFGLRDIRPVSTPMEVGMTTKLKTEQHATADPKFKQRYQSMAGSLTYAATKTRPDIAQATGHLSRFNSNPNAEHMKELERIFAYLRGSPTYGISYATGDIQMYVDSSYNDDPNTARSTTGWLLMAGGGAVSWASRRQGTVSLSSCEAEYKAASEAVQEAVWARCFLQELKIPGINFEDGILLNMDSTSAMKLAKNPEYQSRTKHISVRHHFIREKIQSGEVKINWVSTKDMVADGLTKPLPRPAFEDFRRNMGMKTLEEHMS